MSHTETHSYPSYSQAGEDRILYRLFEMLGSVKDLRYADLGAAAPAGHNNTYLFYTLGGSGVLAEPDPVYCPAYREVRPRDRVEQAAIVPRRLRKLGSVPFHAMEDPGWSTVSTEHVEVAGRLGKGVVRQTYVVPCMTVNELLEKHFPDGRLDILSMDLEGLDQEVLWELDVSSFHPKVIIVEASDSDNEAALNPLGRSPRYPPGYQLFANTFVNVILIASNHLKSIRV
jgi:hypothetical protein